MRASLHVMPIACVVLLAGCSLVKKPAPPEVAKHLPELERVLAASKAQCGSLYVPHKGCLVALPTGMEIGKEFGKDLPDTELLRDPSVASLTVTCEWSQADFMKRFAVPPSAKPPFGDRVLCSFRPHSKQDLSTGGNYLPDWGPEGGEPAKETTILTPFDVPADAPGHYTVTVDQRDPNGRAVSVRAQFLAK